MEALYLGQLGRCDMDERLGLKELIREWETKKQEAEDGERAAMAEAQRWRGRLAAAEEALTHFTYALEALERAGSEQVAKLEDGEEVERQAEATIPVRNRRPERAKRSRRKRSKKPTSVQLIPELVGDEFLSIGEMKRRLDQRGNGVAKQTLEYGVKRLMSSGVLIRRKAPADSSADWIYGLAGKDVEGERGIEERSSR